MYKIRFRDILLISNKKKISNNKIILFFYGLGCRSDDFAFLFRNKFLKSQLFIAELPGHNNLRYNNENIFYYARNIFLFLKKNNIKEIIFFSHSMGGIIPIILTKYFLKRSIIIKNFINYEGNLSKYDTETLTKKTISYNKDIFILEKFDKLVSKSEFSDKIFLNFWSKSLKKTSKEAFYQLSKECVKLSETYELLNFFRIFFKKKVYLNGEYSESKNFNYLHGVKCLKIRDSGHFSFFENKLEFYRIFNRLILQKA